jgi:hypothetical protein
MAPAVIGGGCAVDNNGDLSSLRVLLDPVGMLRNRMVARNTDWLGISLHLTYFPGEYSQTNSAAPVPQATIVIVTTVISDPIPFAGWKAPHCFVSL